MESLNECVPTHTPNTPTLPTDPLPDPQPSPEAATQHHPLTAQSTPNSPSSTQINSPIQPTSPAAHTTPVQLPLSPTQVQPQPTPGLTQHVPAIVQNPLVNPNPDSVYPMVTRFRVGTNHPTERLNLHVSSVSPLPKSYRDAFNDPNWQNAMRDEYTALIKNETWTLVPRPPDTNIVRCMWLFRHKYLADGTLSRYKACLVANGSTQLKGVDVDETFSPVVKPDTIRTTVYMHQPPGFGDSVHPDYVCLLQRQETDTAYLLLYADDIVITASSESLLQQIIRSLHQEFAMTDVGPLNYFLGISVTRDASGLFLSQKKYALEILDRAHMVNYNPSQTPIDTESKLGSDVQQVCLYMHDPREPHFLALKRILRLIAYSDADWVGCPTTRRSTSVATGQVRVLHVPSRYQFADIFTKGLPSALFEEVKDRVDLMGWYSSGGGGLMVRRLVPVDVPNWSIILTKSDNRTVFRDEVEDEEDYRHDGHDSSSSGVMLR
ncbi:ribonuclease H-like domain-containing protein [Tanacetum coccineum]|uniref:Ribonuclease H-like domain-containing protein n=1 Tax=Tanacetum coccineum TaxID=301880 RepID=A0ABQ5AMF4_9ASTR